MSQSPAEYWDLAIQEALMNERVPIHKLSKPLDKSYFKNIYSSIGIAAMIASTLNLSDCHSSASQNQENHP